MSGPATLAPAAGAGRRELTTLGKGPPFGARVCAQEEESVGKSLNDDMKVSMESLTLCRDVRTRVSAGSTHLRASRTRVTLFSKLSVQRWNPRIPFSKSCRIILTDNSTPYVLTAASSCCVDMKGQTEFATL